MGTSTVALNPEDFEADTAAADAQAQNSLPAPPVQPASQVTPPAPDPAAPYAGLPPPPPPPPPSHPLWDTLTGRAPVQSTSQLTPEASEMVDPDTAEPAQLTGGTNTRGAPANNAIDKAALAQAEAQTQAQSNLGIGLQSGYGVNAEGVSSIPGQNVPLNPSSGQPNATPPPAPIISNQQVDAALAAGKITPEVHEAVKKQNDAHQDWMTRLKDEALGGGNIGKTAQETGLNVAASDQAINQKNAAAQIRSVEDEQKAVAAQNQQYQAALKEALDKQALEQQQSAAELKKTSTEYRQQLDQHQANVAAQLKLGVDPDAFWGKGAGGTGRHILGALAMAFGSFGATLNHTQNFAAESIENAINRNVAAQKENLGLKLKTLDSEGATIHEKHVAALEDATATARLRAEGYATAAAQASVLRDQMSDPVNKAKADSAVASLVAQRDKSGLEYAITRQAQQQAAQNAAAAVAAHQLHRKEEAEDTETKEINELRTVGGKAAGEIDVNSLKPGSGPKASQAGLETSVRDVTSFADPKNGEYPDESLIGRHSPDFMVSDNTKKFRSAVDNSALAYWRQLAPGRLKGETAEQQIKNARHALFGTETPNAEQLKAGIRRMQNLAAQPGSNEGASSGGD